MTLIPDFRSSLFLNIIIQNDYNNENGDIFYREGKSNAHLNGDYQRIGDIMVNSFLTALEVIIYDNFMGVHEKT